LSGETIDVDTGRATCWADAPTTNAAALAAASDHLMTVWWCAMDVSSGAAIILTDSAL
jgi:hypothetical protein